MLRFAPSPTGDMHIGNLRVAIFNHILSKQLKKDLLIRIEDIEKEKVIEGKDKEILELLSLFSIDYKGVVYQSENLKYHQKMVMQLMAQKKAFACFCSNEKLEELKQTAQKENRPYEYDGFCATLSDETVLNCNAPFTVRISKPLDNIQFNDQLNGNIVDEPYKVDSFTILEHDKSPTYSYACAVDDMLYDISTVIRQNDYLSSTAKQIHIRQSLGYEKEINYIHLPSITNNDDFKVKNLIDEGYLPSAIANYLVLLGNETPTEIFTLEDAVEWFDIKNISKTPAIFDIQTLQLLNKKHLSAMDEMRLSKILGFADTDIGKLAKLFIEEINTIKEIKLKLDSIFSTKTSCEGHEKEFKILKKCLLKAPFFNDFNELKKYILEDTGLEENTLSKPLRYLLTGQNKGPELTSIYPLIKNYLGEIVK